MAPRARPESLFDEIVRRGQIQLGSGKQFRLVAGPGERLGELAPGDLLVRESPKGDRPWAARIRSAPATPEDLFLEGVMAERGPSGLYVEVAGPGAYPVAQRISDLSRRVAPRTLVMRPTSEGGPGQDSIQESPDDELKKQRAALMARITRSDLYWHEVPLLDGYRILVSSPILKDELFVPGTTPESLDLARRFEVFPLSRAVMDQAHNAAIKVEKRKTPSSLFDFVAYSALLRDTPYYTSYGYALSSGAHKLWVISARGPVINYGFYIPRRPADPVRCGPRLDRRYNVIQDLGAVHAGTVHWDYSQLLQFMSGLRDPAGGQVDLRQALLDGNRAVWDEAQPPAAGSLP